MHVAFALMIAVPGVILVRNRVLKVLWAIYPLARDLRRVATANHFWIDAALGALVAAVVRARRLYALRARPARMPGPGAPPRRGHVSDGLDRARPPRAAPPSGRGRATAPRCARSRATA